MVEGCKVRIKNSVTSRDLLEYGIPCELRGLTGVVVGEGIWTRVDFGVVGFGKWGLPKEFLERVDEEFSSFLKEVCDV